MPYFCVLSATEQEQEIALAELWALAGVEGKGRVVRVPQPVDAERTAYVATCAEMLAHGPRPEAIAEQLAATRPTFERFRVTLLTLPPRPKIDSQRAIVEVARHVYGTVDLQTPLQELLLVGTETEWHFGRLVSRTARSYAAHEHKPHQLSSALPARVARAMVSLVAKPGDRVIDPCCGTGTILLEAWAAGASAVGGDVNPKLAGMTRENLEHFRRPPWVCAADATTLWVTGDAVVTDLPYGRQTQRTPELYARLLSRFPSFAPRLAVVTAEDITDLLIGAGYEVLRTAAVPKPSGFSRRIHVARVR
jgi:tRNA G10  N-methylase Trm11